MDSQEINGKITGDVRDMNVKYTMDREDDKKGMQKTKQIKKGIYLNP